MKASDAVIYLASRAVNDEVPDMSEISGANIDEVLSFASYHMMGAAVSMSLEKAGYSSKRVKGMIASSVMSSMYYDELSCKVLGCLEEAGIWYMPLKGAVLKDWYPRYGMRQMRDRDILFDASRARNVRKIMEGLGFSTESFYVQRHDQYVKGKNFMFEMHKALFFEEEFYRYYADIRDKMRKDDGNNYGYHLGAEDLYVYMTAHEYMHYSCRGIGLRSLLDVYVLMKRFAGSLDMEYISRETAKLGISEFEKDNRILSLKLFGSKNYGVGNRKMLEYIIGSGVSGNTENMVRNHRLKYGGGIKGKLKYIAVRVFLPSESMKNIYPVLGRYKVLYPFLYAHRILMAMMQKWHGIVVEEVSFLLKDDGQR